MIRFRRVLVPHDFSAPATSALSFAADLIPPGGRIVVLHVVVPFTPITEVPTVGAMGYVTPAELIRGAKQHLERTVAKTLRGRLQGVETRVVLGDPYTRIIEASRGMDAIVMATAGRTGLAHLLIGSVAEKVVRHSRIPVVTLPGRPRRAPARKAKR
jgi:nucleotide-binding universal stress UspA family protein